ncbi:MAG TPA: hypothetical protein VFQ43_09030 [Nitrososphaera sp.]|nr:hypothetical protein [Nitrososphaera sp.]
MAGDNVVESSINMPWFYGPSLLEYLETVQTENLRWNQPFRFPVQRVIRPHQDYRGYAGRIASGMVRAGDEVLVLPSGQKTRVREVVSYGRDLEIASPSMSISLTLDDELDICRGDLICSAEFDPPRVSSRLTATLVWFNELPLQLEKSYLLKHTARTVRAEVKALRNRLNINTFAAEPAGTLQLNEIGVVEIETSSPLYFDAYQENPITGSLLLIDPATNATVAAGMILSEKTGIEPRQPQQFHKAEPVRNHVTITDRLLRYGHVGAAVNLQGRMDVAYRLERILFDQGAAVVVLKDASSHVIGPLVNSGFLVLDFGTMDFMGQLNPGLLPPGEEEAARALYDFLLRSGVVTQQKRSF